MRFSAGVSGITSTLEAQMASEQDVPAGNHRATRAGRTEVDNCAPGRPA